MAHDKGVGMIEPALRDRLTAVYSTWLDQDDFGQRYVQVCGPHQDADVTSVQQFLGELLQLSSGPNAHMERPAALEHRGLVCGGAGEGVVRCAQRGH